MIQQCIRHAVNKIFLQQDANMAQCKEAILEKKLNKGDGRRSQCKEILGWLLDSSWGTLELMPQWAKHILDIFEEL